MRVREGTGGGMEKTGKHSREKSKTYKTVNTYGDMKEQHKSYNCIYNCDIFSKALCL